MFQCRIRQSENSAAVVQAACTSILTWCRKRRLTGRVPVLVLCGANFETRREMMRIAGAALMPPCPHAPGLNWYYTPRSIWINPSQAVRPERVLASLYQRSRGMEVVPALVHLVAADTDAGYDFPYGDVSAIRETWAALPLFAQPMPLYLLLYDTAKDARPWQSSLPCCSFRTLRFGTQDDLVAQFKRNYSHGVLLASYAGYGLHGSRPTGCNAGEAIAAIASARTHHDGLQEVIAAVEQPLWDGRQPLLSGVIWTGSGISSRRGTEPRTSQQIRRIFQELLPGDVCTYRQDKKIHARSLPQVVYLLIMLALSLCMIASFCQTRHDLKSLTARHPANDSKSFHDQLTEFEQSWSRSRVFRLLFQQADAALYTLQRQWCKIYMETQYQPFLHTITGHAQGTRSHSALTGTTWPDWLNRQRLLGLAAATVYYRRSGPDLELWQQFCRVRARDPAVDAFTREIEEQASRGLTEADPVAWLAECLADPQDEAEMGGGRSRSNAWSADSYATLRSLLLACSPDHRDGVDHLLKNYRRSAMAGWLKSMGRDSSPSIFPADWSADGPGERSVSITLDKLGEMVHNLASMVSSEDRDRDSIWLLHCQAVFLGVAPRGLVIREQDQPAIALRALREMTRVAENPERCLAWFREYHYRGVRPAGMLIEPRQAEAAVRGLDEALDTESTSWKPVSFTALFRSLKREISNQAMAHLDALWQANVYLPATAMSGPEPERIRRLAGADGLLEKFLLYTSGLWVHHNGVIVNGRGSAFSEEFLDTVNRLIRRGKTVQQDRRTLAFTLKSVTVDADAVQRPEQVTVHWRTSEAEQRLLFRNFASKAEFSWSHFDQPAISFAIHFPAFTATAVLPAASGLETFVRCFNRGELVLRADDFISGSESLRRLGISSIILRGQLGITEHIESSLRPIVLPKAVSSGRPMDPPHWQPVPPPAPAQFTSIRSFGAQPVPLENLVHEPSSAAVPKGLARTVGQSGLAPNRFRSPSISEPLARVGRPLVFPSPFHKQSNPAEGTSGASWHAE